MAHTKGMKLFTMILMSAMLSLSACAKKEGSGATRVTGSRGSGVSGGGSSSGGGTPTGINKTCQNGQSAVGKIYKTIGYESDYRYEVVSFLSATLNEQYIGHISGNMYAKTGIDFEAKFRFNDDGSVNTDQSQLLIAVYDSLVNTVDPQSQQFIQPYRIFFAKAAGGQVSNNGSYTVKFGDEYGDIVFQGTYSSSNVTKGTVSYSNNTNVNGGPSTSGRLGEFQVLTCGVF